MNRTFRGETTGILGKQSHGQSVIYVRPKESEVVDFWDLFRWEQEGSRLGKPWCLICLKKIEEEDKKEIGS